MKTNAKRIFFEHQDSRKNCRLHVINNALGRLVLSRNQFYAYCDQFDMQYHCQGSREFFFIESNDNILSFILNKFHIQTTYYSADKPPNFTEETCENMIAVMAFDDEHIWCDKKIGDLWYRLDSLSKQPEVIDFRRVFARHVLGWIIVWKKDTTSDCLVVH